jgi:hypothetical protein
MLGLVACQTYIYIWDQRIIEPNDIGSDISPDPWAQHVAQPKDIGS